MFKDRVGVGVEVEVDADEGDYIRDRGQGRVAVEDRIKDIGGTRNSPQALARPPGFPRMPMLSFSPTSKSFQLLVGTSTFDSFG